MKNPQILFPMLALFLLTNFILLRLGIMRWSAVKKREVDPRQYKLMRNVQESDAATATLRNYMNLLEMPILFYIAILTAYVATSPTQIMISTAWLYVLLRFLHSAVHLAKNYVPTRFTIFALSNVVLLVLWLEIFWDLISKFPFEYQPL